MSTMMPALTAPTRLGGRHVSLEPLRLEHADALRVAAADGELWTCWYTNVPAPDAVEGFIEAALSQQAAGSMLPFAVRDASGAVVGTTRYYDIDATVPRLSIGYTWY